MTVAAYAGKTTWCSQGKERKPKPRGRNANQNRIFRDITTMGGP